MIATLTDGRVVEGPITSLCVGLVASKIELQPSDVRVLRNLLQQDPRELEPVLAQLENRWLSERKPGPKDFELDAPSR